VELAGGEPLDDLILEGLARKIAGRVFPEHLDDVVAELGLDRLADLAGLQRERGVRRVGRESDAARLSLATPRAPLLEHPGHTSLAHA
jgi:hypothetical protein